MKHFALPLLMASIALPVAANAQSKFTPEQTKEIEAMIKEYVLNNGGDIIQSVNNFQQEQEEEANKASADKAAALIKQLKDDKNIASVGNPDGDVIVVEFFDYNCGYCKKAFEEVQKLLKEDKNVRVVLYDMPILSEASHRASEWSLAAKKQGKYFEFHQALMTHQGGIDEETMTKIAKDLGLDVEKLKKDAADPAIKEEIATHIATARELNIQGTPGFLVNEQVFRGYIPYDQMTKAIADARKALKD